MGSRVLSMDVFLKILRWHWRWLFNKITRILSVWLPYFISILGLLINLRLLDRDLRQDLWWREIKIDQICFHFLYNWYW